MLDVKKLLSGQEKLSEILKSDNTLKITYALSHGIMAFALANGAILNHLAPFGVAFVAASSGTVPANPSHKALRGNALAALIGAILGYIICDSADGLKYLCAAILCYAAGGIFADSRIIRSTLFMPLISAFSLVATNAIYLIAGNASFTNVLLFTVETLLCGACTWFYTRVENLLPTLHLTNKSVDNAPDSSEEKQPLETYSPYEEVDENSSVNGKSGRWEIFREVRNTPLTQYEVVSIFVCIATVVVSFASQELFFDMNLGRLVNIFVVLACTRWSGGTAACIGLCLGLALDLTDTGLPINSAVLGLCGLFGSLLHRFGALTRSISFVCAYGAALPWLYASTQSVSVVYEPFLVSVIYFLFHDEIDKLTNYLRPAPKPAVIATNPPVNLDEAVSPTESGYVKKKLDLLSCAFRNLYDTLIPGVEETDGGDEATVMFESAAMRVCKKCSQATMCWSGDSVTRNALNDASPAIRKRGRACSNDFAPYFAARCSHFPEFLTAVNEAIAVSAYRKRFKRRVYDDVRLLCAQYEGMNSVIRDVTNDLSVAPRIDRRMSKRLSDELQSICDLPVQVTALAYPHGQLSIELETDELTKLQTYLGEFLPIAERIADSGLSVSSTVAVGADISKIILTRRETYRVRIGVGLRCRDGETKSGDTCVHFKTPDGRLWLIISDGMGSGDDAAEVSRSAVKLLESFLRSGVSVTTALTLICPAFAIKNESRTFTTIDLLCIDLFTGNGEFYKCGAAPSFIISGDENGGQLRRITSNALPAGLFVGDGLSADKTTVTFHDKDTVVMVSDGIADNGGDAPLLKLLSEHRTDSASDLARCILDSTPDDEKGDDMTVFVLKLLREDDE